MKLALKYIIQVTAGSLKIEENKQFLTFSKIVQKMVHKVLNLLEQRERFLRIRKSEW